jgi:hypothetical protein
VRRPGCGGCALATSTADAAFYTERSVFAADLDERFGKSFRVVQLTPPGSGLVSNRSRLAQTLLAATVLLALPAVAIWVAVLAFIALAILVRAARRSGR